jgi:peptidoglycan-N-acetylglucosamine deacetylase
VENLKTAATAVWTATWRNVGRTIVRIATDEPVAALTFDDGPDPIYTPKLLEILKGFETRATFFMVGKRARGHSEVVQQVALEGHAIGNHSWSHQAFPLIGFVERWHQIRECRHALRPYGHRLFRAPYGLTTRRYNLESRCYGYRTIGWDVSCEDWCEPEPSVMVENLLQHTKRGSIILLHDCLYDRGRPECGPSLRRSPLIEREPMLDALVEFLERLAGKFRFVTVPDLLRLGRIVRG